MNSLTEFKQADLDLSAQLEAMSPRAARDRYASLPSRVDVRGRDVEIDYDVEEDATNGVQGVARLRLPEKVARTLTESELPALDRPLRFVVTRGQRGSVRATTLEELQTRLDAPWTEEEIARFNRKRDEQREANQRQRRDRVASHAKRGLREGRNRSSRPGRREREAQGRDTESSPGRGDSSPQGRGRSRGPGRRGKGGRPRR